MNCKFKLGDEITVELMAKIVEIKILDGEPVYTLTDRDKIGNRTVVMNAKESYLHNLPMPEDFNK